MSSPITLRPAGEADAPFLLAVYAGTRADELALTGWDDAQKDAFCRMQFAAQDRYYREQFPATAFDVVERDGVPVGRLYVERAADAIHVHDIALLPAYRNAGTGTALLRRLFAEADRAGKPVRIHVERFNPARRLYDRLGFRPVREDGVYVLMERPPQAACDPVPQP